MIVRNRKHTIRSAEARSTMRARVVILSQVLFALALAASSLPSASAVALFGPSEHQDHSMLLLARHGGEEHEAHEDTMQAGGSMMATMAHAALEQAGSAATAATDAFHEHMDGHDHTSMGIDTHVAEAQEETHTHAHSHGHMDHHGGPHPYDGVPDASIAGSIMIAAPQLPPGSGGHSHGSGNVQPKYDINETAILRSKGPESLSYIEWDFAYGIGKASELQRFTDAYTDANETWSNLMGVSGGRYRSLVDEKEESKRKDVIRDIKDRLKASKDYVGRHRFLMILHIVGCVFSCFVLLPIALALRAAESDLAPFASLIYLGSLTASMFCSTLYKAMTPRLYPSNSHSGLGYAIFWLSILALGGDVLRLVKQIWSRAQSVSRAGHRSSRASKSSVGSILSMITLSRRQENHAEQYDPLEEERMLSSGGKDEDEDDEDQRSGMSDARELDVERFERTHRSGSSRHSSTGSHSPPRSVHFEQDEGEQDMPKHARSWSRDLPSPTDTLLNTPRSSLVPDLSSIPWNVVTGSPNIDWRQTLPKESNDSDTSKPKDIAPLQSKRRTAGKRASMLRSVIRYTHVTVARSIVPVSFAAAYTGLAVYTGSCRTSYKNVCLAHGIKGGIFFWYGLLTFGRYLGAYADLGWAWNRRPSASRKGGANDGLSAEWVECLVIFIYGATNTWMERFNAAPGDPYTVKEVQHISIAVMFWFAGLIGLILETKSLKSLLALPVTLRQDKLTSNTGDEEAQPISCTEAVVARHATPPSYNFSFNPFPALVIGVTGAAMAAHHQDYVYEVSVHDLWGKLLVGFSAFRILTYFFLWLRPPTNSVMPSRPPTEALASFSLACGGLVFMMSSEEVSFVAMRNGFGDFMMILNVTVAIVSLIFCEIAGLMILKAWAVKREQRRRKGRAPRSVASPIRLEEGPYAPSSTFVIGTDEDERTAEQDEKRIRLNSSPEQV